MYGAHQPSAATKTGQSGGALGSNSFNKYGLQLVFTNVRVSVLSGCCPTCVLKTTNSPKRRLSPLARLTTAAATGVLGSTQKTPFLRPNSDAFCGSELPGFCACVRSHQGVEAETTCSLQHPHVVQFQLLLRLLERGGGGGALAGKPQHDKRCTNNTVTAHVGVW